MNDRPEALAPMFLARVSVALAPPEVERLEIALRACDEAARAALPDVRLSVDAFVAHLADQVKSEPDVLEALARIHPADLFLACACARGVPGAFDAFERGFMASVPGVVARIDGSAGFADDVAQEIRAALLVPADDGRIHIGDYSGRAALAAYLRVIALRIALRLRRERGGPTAPFESDSAGVDPELDYLKIRYRGAYETAVAAALQMLSDRDKLLLRLQYVEGLNLDKIGDLYGVNRSTVARWRASVRHHVLESTRARLHELVGLTDSQIDSLWRVVRSEMRISLRRALETQH